MCLAQQYLDKKRWVIVIKKSYVLLSANQSADKDILKFLFKNFKYIGYIIEWRALMAFTVKWLWSLASKDSIGAAVSFGSAAITLSGVFIVRSIRQFASVA